MEQVEQEKQEPKVTGLRSPRWALMNRMEIPSKQNDGETYLERLRVIQTPWFGVYVHWINEPDYDYDPHDHPWNFTSIILRGGYMERIWPNPSWHDDRAYNRSWKVGTKHRMVRGMAHRIVKVEPGTVSLVITGKREGSWGFYTPEGWVEWTEYEGLIPS